MNRPAWFIATLLLMLAMTVAIHLGSLGLTVQKCAFSLLAVQDRYVLTRPGSPEAIAVAATMKALRTQCDHTNSDFEAASGSYQTTLLALLGGAGVSAGVAVVPRRPRQGSDYPREAVPADEAAAAAENRLRDRE